MHLSAGLISRLAPIACEPFLTSRFVRADASMSHRQCFDKNILILIYPKDAAVFMDNTPTDFNPDISRLIL